MLSLNRPEIPRLTLADCSPIACRFGTVVYRFGGKKAEKYGKTFREPRNLLILLSRNRAGSQEVTGSIPLSSTMTSSYKITYKPRSFSLPIWTYLAAPVPSFFAITRKVGGSRDAQIPCGVAHCGHCSDPLHSTRWRLTTHCVAYPSTQSAPEGVLVATRGTISMSVTFPRLRRPERTGNAET